MRKLIVKFLLPVIFLLFTFSFLFANPAHAEGEFASSYNIIYDVDSSGVTNVTEGVTLKNLTDQFYASSFSLIIGSTQISDVQALDSQGPMATQIEKQGTKTRINVKFNQQVSGLNKQYPWSLKFKSQDFAQKAGKTWQVSVPKIASTQNLDNYSLTLSVPVSFGDPTSILPEPRNQNESGGKLNFSFTKEQLKDTGILANFGSEQLFDFHLTFHLTNNGVLPSLAKLPIPANTNYQQVVINNIEPRPENVVIDGDGNYIGYFKIPQKESLAVNVYGLAKLKFNPSEKDTLTSTQISQYTSSQKYWDSNSPQIKAKLDEIFKNGMPKTNQEKAGLINNFVVRTLSYDESRLKSNNFERLGALTVLTNPDQALCSEFADLFISLARAAGIPTRFLEGYAYTSNQDLRPISLGSVLHAWPEYWDPNLGWVMIDPTWQNTTGEVNYFSKLDLNHFVLATRGLDSEEPSSADQVDIKFSEAEFKPHSELSAQINSPFEVFAGLPFKTAVKLTNNGNFLQPSVPFSFRASRINISGNTDLNTPAIPPFGFVDLNYDLKTNSLMESFPDQLVANYGKDMITHNILVKSFFSYNNFSFIAIGVMVLMLLGYGLVFVLHLKTNNR